MNEAGIVADAQYLGIRNWRDSLSAQSPSQLESLRALVNANIGLVGIPLENQTITISDHINRAKVWAALGPYALMALEGPNEPNNFPITYNGTSTGAAGSPSTFMPVAQFQRDYYQAIRRDPVLNTKPLWSVSLIGSQPNNVGLQYLTIPRGLTDVQMPGGTTYADVANLHFYPMYAFGAQTVDETTNRIDTFFDSNFVRTYARGFSGYTPERADALPKVITEFGYPATGGSPYGFTVDIPTQGKNILTGLFNAWAAGYQYVYIYALYEAGDGFGLFWNNYAPKLSATYMHNLTSALADTSGNTWNFIPGQLSYTLSALPWTGKSFLFQKSNGNFALVLWNNIANWNFSAGTPLGVGATDVTVSFDAAAISIAVFDPTSGTAPVKSAANTKSIKVPLSDYPMVVEIAISQ